MERITVNVWIIAGSSILLRAEERPEGYKKITHQPIEGIVFAGEFVIDAVHRIANATVWKVLGRRCAFDHPNKIQIGSSRLRQNFSILLKDFEIPPISFDKQFVFIGKESALMIQKPNDIILYRRIYLSEENIRILFREIWLAQKISPSIEQ